MCRDAGSSTSPENFQNFVELRIPGRLSKSRCRLEVAGGEIGLPRGIHTLRVYLPLLVHRINVVGI